MTTVYTARALDRQPVWFPQKLPSAVLDYALDISTSSRVVVDTDYIHSVVVDIAPSGTGELLATNLSVSGHILTLTEQDGEPTRVYTIRYIVTMFGGKICEFVVNQGVPPVLPTDQAPPAPDPFFGTPVVYTFVPDLDLSSVLNSAQPPLLMI